MRKKKLIPYIRVSSDEQAEAGNSLPNQEEVTKKYIEGAGAEAAPTIADDYTGTKLDRPGLQRVRDMLAKGEADGVVVYRSDRLTRILSHSLILRDEFAKNGWELHFVNHGQYDDSPEGRMIIDIEAVFNQYWRDKLIQDTVAGRRQKMLRGHHPGSGHMPYGYRYDEHAQHLVVYEPEAIWVRKAYGWYILDRLTMRQIAVRLTQEHAPIRRFQHQRKRHALDVFLVTTVYQILSSETYKGTWWYNKKGPNPISVLVPAIVSEETWDQAQAIRKHNKEVATRHQKHAFLLAGLIFCGIDNLRYYGMTNRNNDGREYLKYRCASWQRHNKNVEAVCKNVRLDAPWVEEEVWRGIVALITDEATWEQGIQQAVEHMEAIRKPTEERLNTVDRLIARNVEEADELVQALSHARPGKPVYEQLDRRIDELESVYDDLVAEREGLLATLDKTISADDVQRARVVRDHAAIGIGADATWEEKRRTLEVLETRVTVFPERVVVQCNLAIPAFQIDLNQSFAIEFGSSCRAKHNKQLLASFEVTYAR